MELNEGQTIVNGVTFTYLEAGTGRLALCLHGFPDSAWGWRHLLPALADAGYRAVAPFQRGYAPTEVPSDGRYQTGVLALDACGMHDALGGAHDAVIIGHDWGAAATYGAAAWEPDRWSKVVTMAVPPAAALASGFLSFDQLRRSWYMFFFQHPLADVVVPMEDLAFLDRLWADWSPGYDATEDLVHVKDCLRQPENLAAALGYYRAAIGAGYQDPALAALQAAAAQPTPQPTLYLHGRDDGCLGIEVIEGTEELLPAAGSKIVAVDGAGHFLHLERPDEVNPLIVDFLTS